jgi:hypothetical protein
MVVWAVAAGLLVSILADWSGETEVLVSAVIAGSGAMTILWLRMKQLPELPAR